MTYALIESGIVVNLINLESYNASDFPNAVEVGELQVALGDTYKDETFYHNDKPAMTLHQIMANELYQAEQTIAELDAALLDSTYENIIGGLE